MGCYSLLLYLDPAFVECEPQLLCIELVRDMGVLLLELEVWTKCCASFVIPGVVLNRSLYSVMTEIRVVTLHMGKIAGCCIK